MRRFNRLSKGIEILERGVIAQVNGHNKKSHNLYLFFDLRHNCWR